MVLTLYLQLGLLRFDGVHGSRGQSRLALLLPFVCTTRPRAALGASTVADRLTQRGYRGGRRNSARKNAPIVSHPHLDCTTAFFVEGAGHR